MSQGGPNHVMGSGNNPIEKLTGNTGGAVGPDASFNINILGNNSTGIDIAGNAGLNTLTVVGLQSSTSQRGTITIATNAETITGIVTTKAVTPDDLTAKLGVQTTHGVAIGAGTSAAIAWTGTGAAGQVLTSNGPALDPTFQANGGGDVVGPAGATDNAVARFDGVTGKLIKNSVVTVDNTGITFIPTQLGIGAAASTSALYINAANRIGAWITGSNVSTGSDADGIFVDASFAPSANVTNAASIGLYPTFNPPGGVTITTGYGLYIASGTQGGAGAVTTGYGLFVTHPTFGTTNYAAQIDNLRIDVNSITATNANGTVSVLSDGTGAANFGTNASAHTTTLGSTTTTATTLVQSGSTGITIATSSNGPIGISSGTGTISVSTDATATTLNIGTGAGVKSTFLGSTNTTSTTTVQSGSGALNVTATNGALTINSGTGALSISNDAAATTVAIAQGAGVKTVAIGSTNTTSVTTVECGTGGASFGASANAHTTTLGSTNSTSATTVQSGSGTLSITATNGAITANSGTGTVSVSSDATNTTVNLGTGAGNKLVTLGSTSGASSLALKTGTADFSLASATGTIMSALDTGEITYPLQTAFLAYLNTGLTNKSGTGTAYTVIFDTEVFDQNADFDLASSTLTAPVTGRYSLNVGLQTAVSGAACNASQARIITSNRGYAAQMRFPAGVTGATPVCVALADMDAADTCTFVFVATGEGSNNVGLAGVSGSLLLTWCSGQLSV